MIDPLSHEFNVGICFANPQEHVPEAERNNRVIKERVRASYHRLPYRHLTRMLVKMLVTESTKKLNFFPESAKKLNFFPAKNGASQYYSPRMTLHQRNLDYARHCQYALGTYVQAHDEPKHSNTDAPRSLDCIYLRYNDNVQGGHELLHLPTNSIIRRRTVTPVPITPAIIKQVHTIAEQEDMPAGLKIKNRTGQVFYESEWIAGVDYDEEEFDDELDQDDYKDDDSDRDDDNLPEGQFDAIDQDDVTHLDSADDADKSDDDDQDPPAENAGVAPNVGAGADNAEDGNTGAESDGEEEDDEPDDGEEESNPSTDKVEDDASQGVGQVTRSGRVSKPPVKLTLAQHNVETQVHHS